MEATDASKRAAAAGDSYQGHPQQSYRHWQLNTDLDGLLWLTLDRADSPVNTLGREVIEELEAIVTTIEQTRPAGLVLLSGKRGSFIAGADVREFDAVSSIEEGRGYIERVHRLFERIERLPCPTAVAFEGFCLGGGLELALCFDYRIARDVPATRIGFPEIRLGIYPAFGGTTRVIEKLGATQALPLILQSRTLNARAARSAGLVDQVVGPHQELTWAARRAVMAKRRSVGAGTVARLSNSSLARRPLASYIRKQTEPHANPAHYPAPYALIDAWERHGDDRAAMFRAEADDVPRLLVGDVSRNLRRVFHLMERLKGQAKRVDFKPRRVHVVGAGVMGGDIAAWCALRGLEVTLQDRELGLIEPALRRATALFKRKLKSEPRIEAARGRLRADVAGVGAARADVVIEAIFEDVAAKKQLLAQLDSQIRPDALIATNTSALDLRELSTALARPERLIGLHFFNPVAQMPLIEVVHEQGLTDADAVARGIAFAVQLDKLPVAVRNSPGFLVNRVLGAYMANALALQQRGHTSEEIDHAAEWFGMPMGPVELADTVGLDVGLAVMKTLGADSARTAELERMVASGRKGKKSGDGFYHWKEGKAQKAALPQHVNPAALAPDLMQPYFDECRAALADGIVDDADLLDAAMLFGTGFPPFRGGPLHYQDSLGHTGSGQANQEPTRPDKTPPTAPMSSTIPAAAAASSSSTSTSGDNRLAAGSEADAIQLAQPDRSTDSAEPTATGRGTAATGGPATGDPATKIASARPIEEDPLLGDVDGSPQERTDRPAGTDRAGNGKGPEQGASS